MPVDIFRVRWDAEVAGTSYLMVVVMGRWSEPMSSPTVHSGVADSHTAGCAEAACVHVNTCGGAAVEDTGHLRE